MKSVNSEAVVENPSSLLAAVTNGTALSAAPLGMFSVPSVVPLNRPSNGNGMTALAATGSNSEYALASLPCRSEEHTSELQSLMRLSYAVLCLKKKTHLAKQYTSGSPHTQPQNQKHKGQTTHAMETTNT